MLYNNINSLDLHGLDREYAKILINEFIEDNIKLKERTIKVIHGNGTGILKRTTQEVLTKNKNVECFKINNFNTGETIITLRKHWQIRLKVVE